MPQIRGMYFGDRSRKEVLVAYGFRLPSALDNRPLNFEEWEARVGQLLFVSATPGPYELRHSGGAVVEQIIRPTGLVDPVIDMRPVKGQVDDLLAEIRERAGRGERVLVTTLTKRMAEDLTQYYQELGVKVRYLHSDIDTLERIQILRDLRRGEFDVLVGINLLREGSDLPEVSLVAILDADKEGFLRSGGSLIQTVGRAARNVNGRAIMYADRMTDSMKSRDQRDRTPPQDPGGLQRRARHHADVDRQEHRRGDDERLRARLRHRARPTMRSVPDARRARGAHHEPAGADEGGGGEPRVREGGQAARQGEAAPVEGSRAGREPELIEATGSRRRSSRSRSTSRMVGQGRHASLVTRPFYYRDIIEQFEHHRHRLADRRPADRAVHRDGARAAVGHDAGPVRRPLDGRPAGQRLDGEGARPGADRR